MKKILAIDDKQDNLISIKALLKNYLPDYKVLTALSGKEGIRTARDEQPDTILLDIIMPEMDGYEACGILKNDPGTKHIPVIMLTAIKTDSQSRIKGLKNGADAFLSKPIDPIELTAQVKVMLRIKAAEDELRKDKKDLENTVSERTAELRDSYDDLKQEVKVRKLSEENLKASEEKFRSIAEQVSDMIFLTDDKGLINYISPASSSIFGFTPQEMEGNLFTKFLKKSEIPKAMKEFMKTFVKGEPTLNLELQMKHKDGNYFIGELTAKKYVSDKLKGTIGVIRDVTVSKHAENLIKESEKKFRALYDYAPLPYQSLNPDGSFRDVNPAWLRTLGYERDEVIGKFYKDFLHPDWQLHFEENFPKFKKRGYVSDVQFKIRHKNGSYLLISFEGCIGYNPDGSVRQTYCVFQDITLRKQAEEKLRESKNALQQAQKIAMIGSWEMDTATKRIIWSDQMYDLLEVSKDQEPTFELYFSRVHPEDLAYVQEVGAKVYDNNEAHRADYRLLTPSGKLIFVVTEGRQILDEKGNLVILSGIVQDITIRKEAEAALKNSEEQLRDAQRIASIGNWSLDLQTGEVEMSDVMLDIIGCKDRIEGLDVSDHEKYYTPESWQRFNKVLETARSTGKSYEIEMEFSSKNTKYRFAAARGEAVYNENNNIAALKGTLQDITKRKLADEKLRESKEILELALKGASAGSWSWNLKTGEDIFDERWCSIFGYRKDELKPEVSTWKNMIHPEDRDRVLLVSQKHIEDTRNQYKEEYRMKCKNGKWKWILASGMVSERDPDGEPLKMTGIIIDIDQLKQAEDLLKQRMEELEIFNEAAVDREIAINDLRKEINILLSKFGMEAKYEIID